MPRAQLNATYSFTITPAQVKPAFADSRGIPPIEAAGLSALEQKIAVRASFVTLKPLGFRPGGSGGEIVVPAGLDGQVVFDIKQGHVGTVGKLPRYASAWYITGQATLTKLSPPLFTCRETLLDSNGDPVRKENDVVTGETHAVNEVWMKPLPPTLENLALVLPKGDYNVVTNQVGRFALARAVRRAKARKEAPPKKVAVTEAHIRNWLSRSEARKLKTVQKSYYLRLFCGDSEQGAIGMMPPCLFAQLDDESQRRVAEATDEECEDYIFGRFAPELWLRQDSTAAVALADAENAARLASTSGTGEERHLAALEMSAANKELREARASKDAGKSVPRVGVNDSSDMLLNRHEGMQRECVVQAGGFVPADTADVEKPPKVPRFVDSNGRARLPDVCPLHRIPTRVLTAKPVIEKAIQMYRSLRYLRSMRNQVAVSVNGMGDDSDAWRRGKRGGAFVKPSASDLDEATTYLLDRGIEREVNGRYVPKGLLKDANRNFFTGAPSTADVAGRTDTVIAPVQELAHSVRLSHSLAGFIKSASIAQSMLAKGKTPLDPVDGKELAAARKAGKKAPSRFGYHASHGGLGGGLPPAWPKPEGIDTMLEQIDAWLPLATSKIHPRTGALKLGFTLTPRQREAFRAVATDGVTICQAGAGAGKTLLTAVVYLWLGAVVLTFTSNAAHNIRRRIDDLLRRERRARMKLAKPPPPFAQPESIDRADDATKTRAVTTMAWVEDKARRALNVDPSTPEGQAVLASLDKVLAQLRPDFTRYLAFDEAACCTTRLMAVTLKAAMKLMPRLCHLFLAGDQTQLDGVGSGTPMANLCHHFLGPDEEAASELLEPSGRPRPGRIAALKKMGATQDTAWHHGLSIHILRRFHRFTKPNPLKGAIRDRDPKQLADATLPMGVLPDLSAFARGDAAAIADLKSLYIVPLPPGATTPEDAAFLASSILSSMTPSGVMPESSQFSVVTWRRVDVQAIAQCINSALLGALAGVAPPTLADVRSGRLYSAAAGAGGAAAPSAVADDSDSDGDFDMGAFLANAQKAAAAPAPAPAPVVRKPTAPAAARTLAPPWNRKRPGYPERGMWPNLAAISMNPTYSAMDIRVPSSMALSPSWLFPGCTIMVMDNDTKQPDGPIYTGQTFVYRSANIVRTKWNKRARRLERDGAPGGTRKHAVVKLGYIKDHFMELNVEDEDGMPRTIVLYCRLKNSEGQSPTTKSVRVAVVRTIYRAQGMQVPVCISVVMSKKLGAKDLYVGGTRGQVNIIITLGDVLECIVRRGIIPSAGVVGNAVPQYLANARVADDLLGKMVPTEFRPRAGAGGAPKPAPPESSGDDEDADAGPTTERLSLFGGAAVVEGMSKKPTGGVVAVPRAAPPPLKLPGAKASPGLRSRRRHGPPPPPMALHTSDNKALHSTISRDTGTMRPRTPMTQLHAAPHASQQGIDKPLATKKRPPETPTPKAEDEISDAALIAALERAMNAKRARRM